MARWNEPNGSHYSARYAERKRAAARTRDLQPRDDQCRYCGVHLSMAGMDLFCACCEIKREQIGLEQGFGAAQEWQRNGPYARALRGEKP